MSDWIEILDTLPTLDRVAEFVSEPRAGGIDIFLGTTRAETSADGRELIALDYEAYAEMAVQEMHKLAAGARKQWPIVKQAILHRTGRVALSEASVIIAVSCPHRSEAFAACQWLMDRLKADVPIWKKEIWADGATRWVYPGPEQQG